MTKVFATLTKGDGQYKVKTFTTEEFGTFTRWNGFWVRGFYKGLSMKQVHEIEAITLEADKEREHFIQYIIERSEDGRIFVSMGSGYTISFANYKKFITQLKDIA